MKYEQTKMAIFQNQENKIGTLVLTPFEGIMTDMTANFVFLQFNKKLQFKLNHGLCYIFLDRIDWNWRQKTLFFEEPV